MFERLINYLDLAGVEYQVHDHDPIRTVRDAREKWPLAVARLLKTIAFRHKSGRLYLVAVHALRRVDYASLARLVGHNRRDLHTLSPEEMAALLALEPGELFPLPLFDDLDQIIFDRGVEAFERCYCGSGRLDKTLEIKTADLIRLAGGTVADVAK